MVPPPLYTSRDDIQAPHYQWGLDGTVPPVSRVPEGFILRTPPPVLTRQSRQSRLVATPFPYMQSRPPSLEVFRLVRGSPQPPPRVP